jgi:phosphate transport system substrate-binding protein
MRVFFQLVVSLVLSLHFADACRAQDVLRIHGSNVVGDRVVPVLVHGWMKQIGYRARSDVRKPGGQREITGERDGETLQVQIVGSGSARGFQDLIDGNAELAMLARPPTADEVEDGWQLGRLHSPDQEFVLALQSAVVVVNRGNTIASLDQEQLSRILAGRITDWAQVGARPGPIILHMADARSGLGELQRQVLGDGTAAGIVRHADIPGIERAVAKDARAMGVVEWGHLQPGIRGVPIRVAGRAIEPSRLNVVTEEYPLVRRLQFTSGQLITALGRGFVEYSVSDAGQTLLASRGLLALVPSAYSAPIPDRQVSAYAPLVAGAQRVGLDFHFGEDFSLFESRSAQDLPRLQAFMRRPENSRRRLVLVGLSNRQSSPYMAVSVSNERADLVAQALSDLGVHAAKVRGLGAVLPLTVDKAKAQRNLRVQVWIR